MPNEYQLIEFFRNEGPGTFNWIINHKGTGAILAAAKQWYRKTRGTSFQGSPELLQAAEPALDAQARMFTGDQVVPTFKPSTGPMFGPPNRKRFRPGYERIGGFYGRYNGKPPALPANTSLKYCPGWKQKNEEKFLDQLHTLIAITTGSVMEINTEATEGLCLIPQGTTQSKRIGRTAFIRQIHLNVQIDFIPTEDVTGRSELWRYMLVLDTQCNGALPTPQQVLASTNMQAYNNLEEKGRFVVLWDQRGTIGMSGFGWAGTGDFSGGGNRLWIQYHKKLCIPIEYDDTATTGALGTIRSNNLFILMGGTGTTVKFTTSYRARFTD